jgi:uncharacterized protein YbjQ (UPF0145 family)
MIISGTSGNEIYCLSLKGLAVGEMVVGNSVFSLGLGGWLQSMGITIAGGEVSQITQIIAEGRHAAIGRMEQEAQKHGASGVAGVVSDVTSLAGYTEFLAQGTAVHASDAGPFFSTSASGIDLYCHLDAGYTPVRFAMGNVAYSLGIGAGLRGSLRTMARGEVHEFSQMYSGVRHLALATLKEEAARYGANSVVDLRLRVLPHVSAALELLITGTAAFHPGLSSRPALPANVVTSELTGEELWNLAKLGFVPVSLVMGTSVYSLGLRGSVGSMFQAMSRGELPELTSLVYHARENCLDMVRREAAALGAERVLGNKLIIAEIAPGLIEIFAVGTAVRRVEGMQPATPELIVQAAIVDRESLQISAPAMPAGLGGASMNIGCLVAIALQVVWVVIAIVIGLLSALRR